jgi:RNA polymerase sigma-70 factor (ECF subfamily)
VSPLDRDRELAARAVRGDGEAAEQLIAAALPTLRGLTRRLTSDPEEGDALAQAAVVAALEQLPRYRGEAAFATWLCSIAVRLRASQRRRAAAEQRAQERLTEVPAGDDLAESAVRREAARCLWDLVLELPPAYREAIVARATADSVTEAAERLGMPPGRYRTRLHRARLALRDLVRTRCPDLMTELGYAER